MKTAVEFSITKVEQSKYPRGFRVIKAVMYQAIRPGNLY